MSLISFTIEHEVISFSIEQDTINVNVLTGPGNRGLPAGGSIPQLLRKASDSIDYITEWFTITKNKILTSGEAGINEELYPWQLGVRAELKSSQDNETLVVDWELGDSWVIQVNHNNVTVEFTNWIPRPRTSAGGLILIGVASVTGFSISEPDGLINSPEEIALSFLPGKSAVVEYYSVEDEIRIIQEYQLTDDILTILSDNFWTDPPAAIGDGWTHLGGGVYSCDGSQLAESRLTILSAVSIGQYILLGLELVSRAAGSVNMASGNVSIGSQTVPGFYTEFKLLGSGAGNVSVVADVDFIGTVQLIKVKKAL